MRRLVFALVLIALSSALPHPFSSDSTLDNHGKESTATIKLESPTDKVENKTLYTSANATKIADSTQEIPKNATADREEKHDRRTRGTIEATFEKDLAHNKTADKNDSTAENTKGNEHRRVTRETSQKDEHEESAKQVVKKGQCDEESTTNKSHAEEDSASIKLENESSRRHRRGTVEQNQKNATIAEEGIQEKNEEKVKDAERKENDEDKTETDTTTKKSDHESSKRHRRESLKIEEKNGTVAESKENHNKSSATEDSTTAKPEHVQDKRSRRGTSEKDEEKLTDKDDGELNENTTTSSPDDGKHKRQRRDTSEEDKEEGKTSDNKAKNKASTEKEESTTEKPKHGQI